MDTVQKAEPAKTPRKPFEAINFLFGAYFGGVGGVIAWAIWEFIPPEVATFVLAGAAVGVMVALVAWLRPES